MSDTVTVPAQAPWLEGSAVLARLRDLGHETWFVGGCVRDLLLGRDVHDVDLATGATPDQVEAAFEKTVAVGKSFGVVVVVTPSGGHVEVASFRSDGAYIDGRRPTAIHLSTAVADVERRDFTINALLMGPDGVVVDHVGGRRDLEARTIRGVGNAPARLAEDRLRVLRALRFAARMDLAIAPDTWAAVTSISLTGLSAERVIQEWDKALAGPTTGRGRFLRLCAASGRLAEVTPPLAGIISTDIARTADALDRLPANAPVLAAQAVWLSAAPAPGQVGTWLDRQPLDRMRARSLAWLVVRLSGWQRGGAAAWSGVDLAIPREFVVSATGPAITHDHAQILYRLLRSTCLLDGGLGALDPAHHGLADAMATQWIHRQFAMHVDARPLSAAGLALDYPGAEAYVASIARHEAAGMAGGRWKAAITGDDLKAAGIPAGRELGQWLRCLEAAELLGVCTDRAGGLALLRTWLANPPSAR